MNKENPYLRLINYSEKGVFASTSYDFPDTTLKFNSFTAKNSPVRPYYCYEDSIQCINLSTKWEIFSNLSSDSSKKKIYVFVFDSLTVETVPLDSIRDNYILEKRYEFTLKELDSLKWIIEYGK